jgi:hypothetical protein
MTMSDPVKIASLELENVKRVRAVELTPTEDGLTVIGGRNRQGKTSVLDAIAWALGGDRFKPDKPTRDGAATPARLHVELSNGLVVERSGKTGTLKVTDPTGKRAGQTLVNDFVSTLALDLPRFLSGTDKDRAEALLQVIGVGDQLAEIDARLSRKYEERHTLGQVAERKAKSAEDMVHHDDAPEEPVSVADLVAEQQEILGRNGMNQERRSHAHDLIPFLGRNGMNQERRSHAHDLIVASERAAADVERARERVTGLKDSLRVANEELSHLVATSAKATQESLVATKGLDELMDESTAEVEASIAGIEATNELVRENQAKAKAQEEADELADEYKALDVEVESIRQERVDLLKGADLPLDGLSVDEDGDLTYEGASWSDMSGADQLKVATAVVRKVKPECGFVLVDKLEQMDADTLGEFGGWCASEGLQVIGTRVATDDTCSVVIEDGRVSARDVGEPTSGVTDGAASQAERRADKPLVEKRQVVASATDYGEEF